MQLTYEGTQKRRMSVSQSPVTVKHRRASSGNRVKKPSRSKSTPAKRVCNAFTYAPAMGSAGHLRPRSPATNGAGKPQHRPLQQTTGPLRRRSTAVCVAHQRRRQRNAGHQRQQLSWRYRRHSHQRRNARSHVSYRQSCDGDRPLQGPLLRGQTIGTSGSYLLLKLFLDL